MKLVLQHALVLLALFHSGICKKSALLIIDVQNCFLPGGSLAVSDGDQVIPVINSIREQFDVVAISQDWHCPLSRPCLLCLTTFRVCLSFNNKFMFLKKLFFQA